MSRAEVYVITLYHCPLTRSIRIYWLLEELGLPYTLERVAIAPFRASKLASLLTPESLERGPSHAAHPLGKVPAIEDQDLKLFESGAILEYILERYGEGRLAPAPGTRDRGPYLQWVHFAEATALPPLGDIVSHTVFLPEAERIPRILAEAQTRAAAVLAVIEHALVGSDYLLGSEFSGADIMMGFTMQSMKWNRVLSDAYPNASRYPDRLEARPALQKVMTSDVRT